MSAKYHMEQITNDTPITPKNSFISSRHVWYARRVENAIIETTCLYHLLNSGNNSQMSMELHLQPAASE